MEPTSSSSAPTAPSTNPATAPSTNPATNPARNPARSARRVVPLSLVALAMVAGLTFDAFTDPAAPTDPPAPAELAGEARELDRLIGLFSERAAERNQSLEYRQLGELLLQRAKLDADVADYRGSLDAYSAAVALDPSAPNLLGQGRAALGVHDFATASAAAEALTALDPDDIDGILLAADVAFALEDAEAVVGPLEQLVDLVGDDPAVLVRQAELATLAQQPDAVTAAASFAAQALSQAEVYELKPAELAYYQTYAGRVAHDRGDYDTAERLLRLSLTNAPDDHGALGELARVRAATGELDEAIELLDQANGLIPEPDHVVLVGDLRARTGDPTGATEDYAWAIELATLDSDHARAWGHSVIGEFLDDPDLPPDARAEQQRWALAMVEGASDLDPTIGQELAEQLATCDGITRPSPTTPLTC